MGRAKVLWEVETDDQCRKKAAITRRRRTEPFVGCHQGPRHALNMSGRPDTQSQTSLSRATPWLASPCAPRSEENGRGLSLDFRQREIFSGIQIGLKIIIIIIIIKCRKTSRWLAPNPSMRSKVRLNVTSLEKRCKNKYYERVTLMSLAIILVWKQHYTWIATQALERPAVKDYFRDGKWMMGGRMNGWIFLNHQWGISLVPAV